MQRALNHKGKVLIVILVAFFASGCAVRIQKHHTDDIRKIRDLSEELQEMNRTMALLQERLRDEIVKGDVVIGQGDRGIVVTFVAEVLFDSGKAKIKRQGLGALKKVASVLKDVNNDISIEGHTDNVPIKHSTWKSNWELSSARALSVLHYLVKESGLSPDKLSATGYGEYHPVTTNKTPEGRQKNRRVEIIIKPRLSRAVEGKNTGKIK